MQTHWEDRGVTQVQKPCQDSTLISQSDKSRADVENLVSEETDRKSTAHLVRALPHRTH